MRFIFKFEISKTQLDARLEVDFIQLPDTLTFGYDTEAIFDLIRELVQHCM